MDYTFSGEELVNSALAKIKFFICPIQENNFTPKILQGRVLVFCIVLLLILKLILIGIFAPFPKNIFFADITKIDLVNLLNQSRQTQGLNPLTESSALDQAAALKAQDMVKNNYFNHQSPQGTSPWFWFSKAGYKYSYAGENLAIGYFESSDVFNAWLNSATHKENILNPHYTEVGTAVLRGFGANNAIVVVQNFGSPYVQTVAKSSTVQGKKNALTTPAPKAVTQQKVLSEQITAQPVQSQPEGLYLKTLNFIVYNYIPALNLVCYLILILLIITLFLYIKENLNQKFNIKPAILAKAVVLLIIVSSAVFLDRGLIAGILNHQIIV